MQAIVKKAREEFSNVFGEDAAAYGSAPGRIEVLGNHTDYNEGFILAAAIDRSIAVVGRAIPGGTAKIYSRTFNAGASFDVANPEKTPENAWMNYMMGVVAQLRARGFAIGAFEALVMGDVPLGAGLSSSAAIEVATAMFLKQLYPYELSQVDIALTCQAAENKFVGVNCGILDQFTSVMGRAGQLVYLDCRFLDNYKYFPLGEGLEFVIANTNAPHALVDGAYNRLRESCFRAARHCASKITDIKITHLRDVTLAELDKCRAGLAEEDYRRAKHIVTDNARVVKGSKALAEGDAKTMGRLMSESHRSSRDDFGNSCPELDAMVEIAESLPGCHGARLSGGGFGGCAVCLIDAGAAKTFTADLAARYKEKTGIAADTYLFNAAGGAEGGRL